MKPQKKDDDPAVWWAVILACLAVALIAFGLMGPFDASNIKYRPVPMPAPFAYPDAPQSR